VFLTHLIPPQSESARFGSRLLQGCIKRWSLRTLIAPSPSATAVVAWWLTMIRGLNRVLQKLPDRHPLSKSCQKLSYWPLGSNAHIPHRPDTTGLVGDRVMDGKYTNRQSPRCSKCATPMQLFRRTERFNGLPDLYSFYCLARDVWHVEEGDAVVDRPHRRLTA
jgi:hypothetical protein